MNYKSPGSAKEAIRLMLPRLLVEEMRTRAHQFGLTASDYAAEILKVTTAIDKSASDKHNVSAAGNRIVGAISVMQASILNMDEAVRLLREAQRFIAAELMKASPVAGAVNDYWTPKKAR